MNDLQKWKILFDGHKKFVFIYKSNIIIIVLVNISLIHYNFLVILINKRRKRVYHNIIFLTLIDVQLVSKFHFVGLGPNFQAIIEELVFYTYNA